MPYTPPAGHSVNFTFTSSGYSPPGGSAASFVFNPIVSAVSASGTAGTVSPFDYAGVSATGQVGQLTESVFYPSINHFRAQQQNLLAYEDEQLNQEWTPTQRLRNYRFNWTANNESVSKFVQYNVLTTPIASVAVSKFVQFDVLAPPSGSLSVAKMAQYVVLQPPVTTTTTSGVAGTGQVGTVTTTISSQTTLTGVAGTGAAGTVTADTSTFTVWNAGDLTSTTLDATHLVATATNTGGVRTVDARQSGKHYFELTLTTIASGGSGVGIAAARATLSTVAAVPTAAAIVYKTGAIWLNNVNTFTPLGALVSGNVVGIAIDLDNEYIWFRIAPSGNWNGSATANPVTTTGGISLQGVGLGVGYDVYPVCAFAVAEKVTGNFGASAFSGSVPSGFNSGIALASPSITTNVVATQVGAEVFYQPNNAAVQLTQIGAEVFYQSTNLQFQLTQAGLEVWGNSIPAYNVTQVGFEIWGSVGISAPVTGVFGTGQAGGPFSGSTFGVEGDGAAASLIPTVTVAATGVSGTGQVGTVVIAATRSVSISGATGTTQTGILSAEIDIAIIGMSGTGQAGTVSLVNNQNISISGVAAIAQIGILSVEIDVAIDGVEATGQSGDVSIGFGKTPLVVGVETDAAAGDLSIQITKTALGVAGTAHAGSVSKEIDISINGVVITAQVGDVIVSFAQIANPIGVKGNGAAGTVAAEIDITLQGVQATGTVGSITADVLRAFSSGFAREALLSDSSGSVQVDGLRRESLLADPTVAVRATKLGRETLLDEPISYVRLTKMVRETLVNGTAFANVTSVHVSSFVRETLVQPPVLKLVSLYPYDDPTTDYGFTANSDLPTSFTQFNLSVWCCKDVHIQSPSAASQPPAVSMDFSPSRIVIALYDLDGTLRFSGTWTVAAPAIEYQVLFSVDTSAQTYVLYVNDTMPTGSPTWGSPGNIGWA